MKSLTLIALIVMSASFAQAECEQAAQVTAKVIRAEPKSVTECRLRVSVIRWQPSTMCGLDRGEIDSEGIEIGMINGHDCEYTEEMKSRLENGTILIRNKAGVIVFD